MVCRFIYRGVLHEVSSTWKHLLWALQLKVTFYVNGSICAHNLPGIHAAVVESSRLRGGQLATTLKKEASVAASITNLQGGAPDAQLRESYTIFNSQEFEGWGAPRHPSCRPAMGKNKSEAQRQGAMLWGGQEERMRNYARVWRFILRSDLEKWCLAMCAGSSPAGLELEQPSWQWLLRCSKKGGGRRRRRRDCFTRYISLLGLTISSFPVLH